MKATLLCCLLLLAAVLLCEGRKNKLGTKRAVLVLKRSHHKLTTPGLNFTATTVPVTTKRPTTTDSGNMIVPFTTPRPKKKSSSEFVLRKCCKLGTRGGKKGYNCDWDRFTAQRYTNMEHRLKMKFQGRQPSKRTQRYVRHVVRYCVKTGLKGVYQKCCEYYSSFNNKG